jgi:hypothetical protein
VDSSGYPLAANHPEEVEEEVAPDEPGEASEVSFAAFKKNFFLLFVPSMYLHMFMYPCRLGYQTISGQ